MKDGKVIPLIDPSNGTEKSIFSTYIFSPRPLGESTKIHGIKSASDPDSPLRSAPSFPKAFSDAVAYIDSVDSDENGRLLVCHNLPFDFRMLEKNCTRRGINFTVTLASRVQYVLCSYALARLIKPESLPASLQKTASQKSNSYALGSLYGAIFDRKIVQQHSSEGDVNALAEVMNSSPFQDALNKNKAKIQTFESFATRKKAGGGKGNPRAEKKEKQAAPVTEKPERAKRAAVVCQCGRSRHSKGVVCQFNEAKKAAKKPARKRKMTTIPERGSRKRRRKSDHRDEDEDGDEAEGLPVVENKEIQEQDDDDQEEAQEEELQEEPEEEPKEEEEPEEELEMPEEEETQEAEDLTWPSTALIATDEDQADDGEVMEVMGLTDSEDDANGSDVE